MKSLKELWHAGQRPPSPRLHLGLFALYAGLIRFTVYRLVNGHSGAILTLLAELASLAVLIRSYRNTRRRDEERS